MSHAPREPDQPAPEDVAQAANAQVAELQQQIVAFDAREAGLRQQVRGEADGERAAALTTELIGLDRSRSSLKARLGPLLAAARAADRAAAAALQAKYRDQLGDAVQRYVAALTTLDQAAGGLLSASRDAVNARHDLGELAKQARLDCVSALVAPTLAQIERGDEHDDLFAGALMARLRTVFRRDVPVERTREQYTDGVAELEGARVRLLLGGE